MPTHDPNTYYVTTPIYYVNDRPHIGHCYTTVVADALARFARLSGGGGREVFFLTGTDEHAEKVVESARRHDMTPLQWADRNAAEFEAAFRLMNVSNDDFIRTTQDRHKDKVVEYIRRLVKTGDIYLGDYTGWFDPSQEEYVTESTAKDSPHGPYTSPVTGKPLVKRTEKNYFFRLSAYQEWLKSHIDANPQFIMPEARRNEVLGRLREGLQDIPVTRAVTQDEASQWGILMPDVPADVGQHRVYVWIDALFNYISTVDTDDRRKFWPADVHMLAKDILWFHAVIWPCLLKALSKDPQMAWARPPKTVYAHAYFVREGKKMSKSLGNFVDLEVLKGYCDKFSVDAVRWYLLTQGPLGATDADFSHAKFVEVYNADLANGLGNCASRVANMIEKYFDGVVPDAQGKSGEGEAGGYNFVKLSAAAVETAHTKAAKVDPAGSLAAAGDLIRQVDGFINATAPFKLAKTLDADPAAKPRLAAILYCCAEAVRIAALLMSPALPDKTAALFTAWNCTPPAGVPLNELARFAGPHGLKPGQKISKGEALFMRADPNDPPPGPAVAQA